MVSTNNYLLKVEDLKTWFPIKKGLLRRTAGFIKAVDGVSFSIKREQTLGLVGESGCGKTTVARSIVRLVPATAGEVIFDRINVLSADKSQLQELRRQISLVFQDPFSSLNPRMTVGNIIGEPLKVQRGITGRELTERVAALLSKVGLSAEHINRYPHEFSGGQRQRIGVARALVCEPKLVICDEPVSALDVSIRSQILNLLKDLQEEFGLTYLFIAHDLAVVEFLCDITAVMYMGRIVERAAAEELYRNPMHPYTRALMSAIPQVERGRRTAKGAFGGEVPSVLNPPAGCPFHPRCPLAEDICLKQMPALQEKNGREGHFVACWKC
jgi:peptide/nickel transport system ATP-binding protein/oligopeptide transport system ATP-binding protein